MAYKLFIFDFDGTLVDTLADIVHYVNSVLDDQGLPKCSVEQVKNAIGLGVHELFKGVAPSLTADPGRLEKAVGLFKKRYREKPVRQSRAFPHVENLLARTLAGSKKAIITNKPEDITLMILDKLKLRRYFDGVIGMNAGHPPKPDPASMFFIMKKFKIPAAHTVYIGDSRIDAETCRNAGVDFVWMSYGYDGFGAFNPRHQFSSARQIGALLKNS